MRLKNIKIPIDKITNFCQHWKIIEFALFGSVLRDDFRSDSDIDVMVTFAPDTHSTLLDIVEMEEKLKIIFGRDVDLVTKRAIEESKNYLRRRAILSSFEVIYAAS